MPEKENEYFAKEYLEFGRHLQLEGKVDEAIKAYYKSLDYYPSAEGYVQLGLAYSAKHKFSEAIDECMKAIALDPDFGNSYNDIGANLIQLERLDEAISWLNKAISAKNYNLRYLPYYNLGKIFEEKGEYNSALENYNEALSIKPNFIAAKNALFRISSLLN
jgi:tetratricopeptide (TPR) repeat protein